MSERVVTVSDGLDALFADPDTLKDEQSDEKFRERVEEEAERREEENVRGRDGMFCVFEKDFEHRGIPFRIHVERYYKIRPVTIDADFAGLGNKQVALGPTDESEELRTLVHTHGALSDTFLQYRTHHSWNDGQTLREMFEEAINRAESDIDVLLDRGSDDVEQRIRELRDGFGEVQKLIDQLQGESGG